MPGGTGPQQHLGTKHRNRIAWRTFALAGLLAVAGLVNWVAYLHSNELPRRQLQRTEGNQGLFTEEQLRSGWIGLYILGVMYIFLALAIVCDEYFVPALDVLVEKWNISADVAGATFMAAGGSAPELFTSLIGTFTQSDVGFGTIVGSAVFNVLFVIGMCAIFSKETLKLTWWPLFRDVTYYSASLLMLALFFGVHTPGEIELWEAAVLFGMYLGYCAVMKFNRQLFHWVMRRMGREELDARETQTRTVLDQTSAFLVPCKWRTGVLQTLLDPESIATSAAMLAVYKIKGNVKETFRTIDLNDSGMISNDELHVLFDEMGIDLHSEAVSALSKELDSDGDGQISFDEFSKWYLKSEHRMQMELHEKFVELDQNNDGTINVEEFKTLLQKLRVSVEDEAVVNAMHKIRELAGEMNSSRVKIAPSDMKPACDPPSTSYLNKHRQTNGLTLLAAADSWNGDRISQSEFTKWYLESQFWECQRQQTEKEAEMEAGVKLHPPTEATCFGWLKFLIALPLASALYFTLPDVRKSKWRNCYALTFLGAIVWIGIFSYFMVSWAEVIGDIFFIPPAVMGLTFLAAGTSIPDLLTSVIVARQGEGDMAVSSSIGSNIFDVLVGLPFPWLAYTLVYWGTAVEVGADTLFVSLLVLFLMLFSVILTIAVNKWRLTKALGATMFVLYAVFVAQDLLRTYRVFA
eukprot:CAMPEP_0119331788 /NCGR_PEP_ID=MMETSP1333-20130426/81388_1 /TAXON_ID=418940 /ORGANISM="Scyphosphaera apsteinii, Strain RCC1455" /LENGTH=690 /DNA_ID=CAMNT_0007341473 /DNA_START=13 /DNA_END=2085 /DNA_ORIENTATION=+